MCIRDRSYIDPLDNLTRAAEILKEKNIFDGFTPFSYTHLYVYKRQDYYQAILFCLNFCCFLSKVGVNYGLADCFIQQL